MQKFFAKFVGKWTKCQDHMYVRLPVYVRGAISDLQDILSKVYTRKEKKSNGVRIFYEWFTCMNIYNKSTNNLTITMKKHKQNHSVLTICTQTGTCDTRSGDLVFFSAAFDEFSLFTKN